MLDKADFTDQKGRLIPDISLSSIQSRLIPSAAPRARGKEPSATAISEVLGPIPGVTVKLIAMAQLNRAVRRLQLHEFCCVGEVFTG